MTCAELCLEAHLAVFFVGEGADSRLLGVLPPPSASFADDSHVAAVSFRLCRVQCGGLDGDVQMFPRIGACRRSFSRCLGGLLRSEGGSELRVGGSSGGGGLSEGCQLDKWSSLVPASVSFALRRSALAAVYVA